MWRGLLAFAALLAVSTPCRGQASATLVPWPGRPLPPVVLERLGGAPLALADHRGAPVLVHYFATWCLPCRRELPALTELASRLAITRLQILVISVAEPDARVKRFFETMPVPFPVLLDRQRMAAKAWGVDVLPTTILLDARLEPRLFVEGEFDWLSQAAADAIRSLGPPASGEPIQPPLKETTP